MGWLPERAHEPKAYLHPETMYSLSVLDLAEVPSSMPVTTEEEPALPLDFTLAPGYPNPFTTHTTLTYRLATAADVKIEIFDVRGRHIATLTEGLAEAGTHTMQWHTDAIASGTYLARLTISTTSSSTTRTTTLTCVR